MHVEESHLGDRLRGQLGSGVVIRANVNVSYPWRLTLGDDVWLGDEVLILSLAVLALRHARRQAPTSVRLWMDLGFTYARLGRSDRALECYGEAAQMGETEADFLAAHLLKERGDEDAAARRLVRAIQRNAEFARLTQLDPEWDDLRRRADVRDAIRGTVPPDRS